MDIQQLEFFVSVAEMGSFTRAASFLSVAQPVLSRHVRALEVELRQPLLERNGRGVTLTEAGRLLFQHGRVILSQIEAARIEMEQARGVVNGRVVVALPPSVGRTLTVPLVRAFRSRFPHATLCVLEGLSTYLLEWLAIGRADCAVVYTVPASSSIQVTSVLSEKLYLISKVDTSQQMSIPSTPEAIKLSEVSTLPLVLPSPPHAIRTLLETAMLHAGLKPKVALEIESIPSILDLVLHDNMNAVLSSNAIRSCNLQDQLSARPIHVPQLETTLWIATSNQRPHQRLVIDAIKLVQEVLLDSWKECS